MFWSEKPILSRCGLAKQLPLSWGQGLEALLRQAKRNGEPTRSYARELGDPAEALCELTRSESGYLVRISQSEVEEPDSTDVLEGLPVAVLGIRDTRVRWSNSEAVRLVGAAESTQLAELPLRQLFPLVGPLDEFLASAEEDEVEATLQDFLGRKRSVRVRVSHRGGVATLVLSLASSALLKSSSPTDSRLAGLGMLVAGVAHEINNPLTFVLPALRDASKLVEGMDDKETNAKELKDLLADSLHGVERVAKIASDLREFRRGDEAVARVDVNQVVVDTLHLAEARLSGKVTLRHLLGCPSEVIANSTRLGQVILNLVLNAAQAMPVRDAAHSIVSVRTWDQEGTVVVAVEDNGNGISEDKLGKIFDPFFSTKNAGTGLGLSVCAGIVKRMGGWIEVDSTQGTGSIFTVVLPMAEDAPVEGRASGHFRRLAPRPSSNAPANDDLSMADELPPAMDVQPARILVVDDEPLVIRSVKRMLAAGAEIIQATGGWEAVRLLRDGEEVDFVVSDMVMPEGGGHELWNWIKENRPELKKRFCFMTGMAPTTESDPDLPPTIHKPFNMEELEQKLKVPVGHQVRSAAS